jgi:murein DD-endopeptidase MepM/ murein hydrolase activator NlpD
VDIGSVGYNSEIYAAKSGTVIISTKVASYGNYVSIAHPDGTSTLYAHMSSRKVTAGQKVKQGDVIGITGSTGVSSGPHLHFEITEKGARVDPLKYLKGYVRGW